MEAMALAVVFIEIHAAVQYGFVAAAPTINVDRCEQILDRGRAVKGQEHWPSPGAVARARLRVIAELAG
jgi:hypothetical protein